MVRFLTDEEMKRRVLRYGRHILLLINACLLVTGLLLMASSVWVLDEARGFVMNSFYSTCAIMLTISGLFCIALGIIGCLGSQEKAKVSLLIFIWGLTGVFVLFVTTQVLAFVFTTGFGGDFRSWLYGSAKLYFESTLIQDSWDVLQTQLKCCGVSKTGTKGDAESEEAFSVWQTNAEFRKANGPSVPESCCVSDLISSFQNYRQFRFQCQGQKEVIHRADCYQKLQQFIRPKVQFVAFSGLAMSVLLALAILSACFVYQGMQNEVRRRQQTLRGIETRILPERRPVSVSTISENINDDASDELALKTLVDEPFIRVPNSGEGDSKHYAEQHPQTERNFRLSTQVREWGASGLQEGPHVRHGVRVPGTGVQKARNSYDNNMRAGNKPEFSIRRPGAGNESRRLQW